MQGATASLDNKWPLEYSNNIESDVVRAYGYCRSPYLKHLILFIYGQNEAAERVGLEPDTRAP